MRATGGALHLLPKIGPPIGPRFFSARGARASILQGVEMAATSYVVSVFDKQHWRTILTTGDKGEAEALEQAMSQDSVKVRVEEITPKAKKRSRCSQVSTA